MTAKELAFLIFLILVVSTLISITILIKYLITNKKEK